MAIPPPVEKDPNVLPGVTPTEAPDESVAFVVAGTGCDGFVPRPGVTDILGVAKEGMAEVWTSDRRMVSRALRMRRGVESMTWAAVSGTKRGVCEIEGQPGNRLLSTPTI